MNKKSLHNGSEEILGMASDCIKSLKIFIRK